MELDLLFEVTPGHRKVNKVIAYGENLDSIMSGHMPGPEGACFDLHVTASTSGQLAGNIEAIVSMAIKPNGNTSIKLHETLTLNDGECVKLDGTGISLPGDQPGTVKVRGVFKFYTTSENYTWLNSTMAAFEAWGDPSGSDFNLKAYALN